MRMGRTRCVYSCMVLSVICVSFGFLHVVTHVTMDITGQRPIARLIARGHHRLRVNTPTRIPIRATKTRTIVKKLQHNSVECDNAVMTRDVSTRNKFKAQIRSLAMSLPIATFAIRRLSRLRFRNSDLFGVEDVDIVDLLIDAFITYCAMNSMTSRPTAPCPNR